MALHTDTIETEQLWSRKEMSNLWTIRDQLDTAVSNQLNTLYKTRQKDSIKGKTSVKYTLGGKDSIPGKLGFGRLYSKGFETFENEVRGSLCSEFYDDIDIVNCHPVLMHQLAANLLDFDMVECKKFCESRADYYAEISENKEEAKAAIFKILYGGACTFKSLVPLKEECDSLAKKLSSLTAYDALFKATKDKNILGSFLSLILQTEERKVMLAMRQFFMEKEYSVDVLCYDGIMVRKVGDKSIDSTLLRVCEESVFEKLKYRIQLSNKPFSKYFITEDDLNKNIHNKLIPTSILINDSYAAEKFAGLCGNTLVKQMDGSLLGFDSETGLWQSDLAPLIHHHRKHLVWYQEGKTGIRTFDYGGSVKNIHNLLALLPNFVAMKHLTVESSIGKLLWNDGIYDFNTRVFSRGFNPEIVFRHRINRPFPCHEDRDRSLERTINRILFEDPYLAEQKEQAEFFKTGVARGIYGDYRAKRAYICVGQPNCGRGLLTSALQQTFEGYISTFNTNSLLYNANASEDDEKKNAWLLSICDSRIAISNEVSMTNKYIDANRLKSASSGGDTLRGRFNHKDAIDFVVRATLLTLTNDIPEIKPADQGLLNRMCVIELKKTYKAVPEPYNPYEGLEDRTLKNKFETVEWQDSLFWILEEAWAAFAKTDMKALKPASVLLATSEWVETNTTIQSILEQGFILTKNPQDYVPYKQIEKYLKSKGCIDSATKIGRELSKLGMTSVDKKVDGSTTKVRIGIKRNQQNNIIDD
jgi:hypothetical protein